MGRQRTPNVERDAERRDAPARRPRAERVELSTDLLRSTSLLRSGDRRTALATLDTIQRTAGNRAVQRVIGDRHPNARIERRAARDVVVSREVIESKISETTDTGNKYTQNLVLNKTSASLQVQLGIHWVKQGTWASDAAFATFIRTVKSAGYSYMDNKFKIVCTPMMPLPGLTTIELPITFLLYDSSTGYLMNTHGGAPGGDSAMAAAGGNLFEIQSNGTAEDPITYAHEFGHAALGASDEYANPAMPDRVLSNDHSIMGNYYTQGMSEAVFKARHFQHLVGEVAKAFAGYACSLKEM